MQKNLLVLLLLLVPFFILGQDLEKKWKFSSIEDSKGNPIALPEPTHFQSFGMFLYSQLSTLLNE